MQWVKVLVWRKIKNKKMLAAVDQVAVSVWVKVSIWQTGIDGAETD